MMCHAALRTSTIIALASSAMLSRALAAQTAGAAPTGSPSTLPPTSISGTEITGRTGTQGTSHRAEVRFHDGLLTVVAQDSSLSAVLREIGRQTGMRISGSVRDDRVFGSYGPATPSEILSTLIEGTGSNMLLVNNAANGPAQLILTPRLGGPTPPSPSGPTQESSGDEDENGLATPTRQPIFGGQSPQRSPQQPVADRQNLQPSQSLTPPLSSPTTNNSDSQAVVFPPVNATSTPATATTSSDTTQDTPNGIKTPQQIFEQLQRLRQQQEQTQPQTAPPQ